MSPAQVKECSIWEFSAAVQGWIDANVPENPNTLSEADEDELWNWLQGSD